MNLYSLDTPKEVERLFQDLECQKLWDGFYSAFGWLNAHCEVFEVPPNPRQKVMDSDIFRNKCVEAAAESYNILGYPFYAGAVSLDNSTLIPHCWNVKDGVVFDVALAYPEHVKLHKTYYGFETPNHALLFAAIQADHLAGHVYYEQWNYVLRTFRDGGTIKKDWWKFHNMKISPSPILLQSAFGKEIEVKGQT